MFFIEFLVNFTSIQIKPAVLYLYIVYMRLEHHLNHDFLIFDDLSSFLNTNDWIDNEFFGEYFQLILCLVMYELIYTIIHAVHLVYILAPFETEFYYHLLAQKLLRDIKNATHDKDTFLYINLMNDNIPWLSRVVLRCEMLSSGQSIKANNHHTHRSLHLETGSSTSFKWVTMVVLGKDASASSGLKWDITLVTHYLAGIPVSFLHQ